MNKDISSIYAVKEVLKLYINEITVLILSTSEAIRKESRLIPKGSKVTAENFKYILFDYTIQLLEEYRNGK